MAIKATAPKLSSRSTIVVCIVICIIMLIVLVAAGRAFYTRITHNAKVLSKKQAAESQLKMNIENLPGLAEAYKNLGPTQELVKQSLPDKPDFPAIVATMEVIAGASNVGLNAVSPLASTTPGVEPTPTPSTTPTTTATGQVTGPQPYQFSIAVKGPYSGLLTVLKNLQLSARPTVITGMQVSGTTDELTATITCQTFFFNPPILVDKTEVVK